VRGGRTSGVLWRRPQAHPPPTNHSSPSPTSCYLPPPRLLPPCLSFYCFFGPAYCSTILNFIPIDLNMGPSCHHCYIVCLKISLSSPNAVCLAIPAPRGPIDVVFVPHVTSSQFFSSFHGSGLSSSGHLLPLKAGRCGQLVVGLPHVQSHVRPTVRQTFPTHQITRTVHSSTQVFI
jgi:hypothetical protein